LDKDLTALLLLNASVVVATGGHRVGYLNAIAAARSLRQQIQSKGATPKAADVCVPTYQGFA
jgi:hypothetical protein